MTFYNLSDISSVRTYDYDFPTLTKKGRFTPRKSWQETSTFVENFEQKFPVFHHLDLTNLAIFGGCITDFLIEQSHTINDIDLAFLCEETDLEKAGELFANRVKNLLQELKNFMINKNQENKKKHQEAEALAIAMGRRNRSETISDTYDLNNIQVSRFKNTYEIRVPCLANTPIQVTFFKNIQSLLDQIDIDPTCIAYYNNEIVMTERGRYGLENLLFRVDFSSNRQNLSRKSTERMIKYFDKGFDLVLPNLNMDKLRTRNLKFDMDEVADLKYLLIVYRKIDNKKINVQSLRCPETLPDESASGQQKGAFSQYGSSLNAGQVIHNNIKNVIHQKFDELNYLGEGENANQAFNKNLILTERAIVNSFETVKNKVFNQDDTSNQVLNISVLEQYFTVKSMAKILQEIFTDYAEQHKNKEVVFGNAWGKFLGQYLDELIDLQIQDCKSKLMDLRKMNEGKKLSLFHFETEAEKIEQIDFYGEEFYVSEQE